MTVADRTAAKARRLVKKWQPLLRLQDWVFTVQVWRHFEFPGGELAQARWTLSERHCYIRLLHPADSDHRNRPIVNDLEDSVVHEMLHVALARLTPPEDDPKITDLEQFITATTECLLTLDRRDRPASRTRRRKKR